MKNNISDDELVTNLSTNDLMNRKRVPKNASKKESDYEEKQMTLLKIKRRKEKKHSTEKKKLCDQTIPLAVNYESWKDTNQFSEGFEKKMKANSASQLVRSAKINVYGKSGLTESHVNSINTMSKSLGEDKLVSAFVKSGKSFMNKQVTMHILAQAKLYVASLLTDNDEKKRR